MIIDREVQARQRPAVRDQAVNMQVVTSFSGYTVVVANSAYYGKGMRIAPGADVHDGLLDVVMIGAVSRWRMVTRYPKVYAGSHVELADVHVRRGRVVEVSADRDVVGYGDGERVGPLPVRTEVRPGALQVLLA